MNIDLIKILDEIEKEKGIPKEVILDAIEISLVSAYKKNFVQGKDTVEINIDKESGKVQVLSKKIVVEEVKKPNLEIDMGQAQQYKKGNIKLGDEINVEITPEEFGRIATQTAKQVIVQKIREAERKAIYERYIDKVRDIVTGIVQRQEHYNYIIDLGKTEAILPPNEQVKSEAYNKGKRMKFYVVEVKKTSKGPRIILSRTHPDLLKRLFELEVPEIHEGLVEIKQIAREAGKRSKIAVTSRDNMVDSIGSCIGDRGSRIKSIMTELQEEKIDIIKWHEDDKIFIANSLNPAKVLLVKLFEKEKRALVVVNDQQLSLSIGKEGQNARLAAKLTGWKIDIKSESQYKQENNIEQSVDLSKMA
ncbi:MAG: transcription termination factor NusA [Atribacterota bacterium]|nr:transcription termination factor NusA [Atribacterota bacterium]MDD5636258.1 transcription termination factor NusA [Atribacterota bacterium]